MDLNILELKEVISKFQPLLSKLRNSRAEIDSILEELKKQTDTLSVPGRKRFQALNALKERKVKESARDILEAQDLQNEILYRREYLKTKKLTEEELFEVNLLNDKLEEFSKYDLNHFKAE